MPAELQPSEAQSDCNTQYGLRHRSRQAARGAQQLHFSSRVRHTMRLAVAAAEVVDRKPCTHAPDKRSMWVMHIVSGRMLRDEESGRMGCTVVAEYLRAMGVTLHRQKQGGSQLNA